MRLGVFRIEGKSDLLAYALIGVLPFVYFLFIRRRMLVEIDGIRVFSGLVPFKRFKFQEIQFVYMKEYTLPGNIRWEKYLRTRIEVDGKTISIGDDDDFRNLRTALETKCKVERDYYGKGIERIQCFWTEPKFPENTDEA